MTDDILRCSMKNWALWKEWRPTFRYLKVWYLGILNLDHHPTLCKEQWSGNWVTASDYNNSMIYSEWVAPIVPIVNMIGCIRICRDYKVMVNQASKLDDYPIPKTEDFLTKIRGSQKFTKLDLSYTYQWQLLDRESCMYITMNTFWGLCMYTRLPNKISSSPGIFQCVMENLLAGITYVIVKYWPEFEKNIFMVSEVLYCGHKVMAESIPH